jgi:hypothetical protein
MHLGSKVYFRERTVFCLCVASFSEDWPQMNNETMRDTETLPREKNVGTENLNRLPNYSNDTALTKVPSKINIFFHIKSSISELQTMIR